MANPGFQFKGDLYSGTGGFGTSAFGEAPFGGTGFPPVEIPIMQIGSDDLRESRREFVSTVKHERYGHTVAERSYSRARVWEVVYRAASIADLELMRPFFRVRSFYLLPNADDVTNQIDVAWVEKDFSPRFVSSGVYGIKFTIEELI